MKLGSDIADNRPEQLAKERAPVWHGSDPARSNRVKTLLMEALQLQAHQRTSFIFAETDSLVRDEVLSLIAAHERAGTFMGDPSSRIQARSDVAPAKGEEPGAMIGHYRLLNLIGEGGFGRVYLADQREPVMRQVALKIIKVGMDTRQVIARFEAERQVLAMMEHPGIARVIDAGATDSGRPYFVMELVQGVPITAYCDEHRLTVDQRLELFKQLCEAVQYAHLKGIIHRDLKPNNLLVVQNNGRPMLKVIDFGIAKATSGRLGEHEVTENRQLLGTPDYMSPEQADLQAVDIDTRADVYSLGVVLYELLCGTTPLDRTRLHSGSFAEMQRMIREEEPPRPSARVTAELDRNDVGLNRSISPTRLATQLRGDLDWITLKALEKDRDRRYATPAELAEDIRRHLDHQPVVAAPPAVGYLLRKFMRRHRAAVLASALIMLTLVGGTIGTTIGLLRARDASALAREAADEANAVNEFMQEFLTSADPDIHGANVALADVLDEASESAGKRFASQPQLEARVRDVLGHAFSRLGFLHRSELEFRRSAELWSDLRGLDDRRTLYAMTGVGMALVNQERPVEAQQYLGDFLPRLERVFDARDVRRWQGYGVVANALSRRMMLDQAEQLLRDGIAQATAAGADDSSVVELLNLLALTLRKRVNQADDSNRESAIDAFRSCALELLDRASRIGKPGRWYVRNARSNLADVALLERNFADTAAQSRALLEESSLELGDCQVVRTGAMRMLADALNHLGETEESADLYIRLIECVRSRQLGDRDSIMTLSYMCDALPIFDRANRWSEGERYSREVIAMLTSMGGHIGTTTYEAYLAHFISSQGRLDEAETMLGPLLQKRSEDLDPLERVRLNAAWAMHLVRRGRMEEAEAVLQTINAEIDIHQIVSPAFPDEIPALFVNLYRTWGKTAQADDYERIRRELVDRFASGDS